MTKKINDNFLSQDIAIIFFSIIVAVAIVKTGLLGDILNGTKRMKFLGSFISGIFFTSIFTTAPAMVALGEISKTSSIIYTAFFGAMGAVLGDIFIFSFIKDKLSEHFVQMIEHKSTWKRLKVLFRHKYFRWLTFLFGGLIITSPLPDELAISMFGFTRMKMSTFILVSFVFNFIGIVIIGYVSRSI